MYIQLNPKFRLYFLALIIGSTSISIAGEWAQRGQFSSWLGAAQNTSGSSHQLGLRYLPELSFNQETGQNSFLEISSALNMYYSIFDGEARQKIKLYRLQARLAGEQSELRIGLQKISFGPAQILRALRWFDQIDPNDPLSLTTGVYAMRYQYTFLSNANVWLWFLYGNEKVKGIELNPTKKERPEWGGRAQLPLPGGEVALCAHSRKVAGKDFDYTETRLALDLRMDFILGWWMETVIQESKSDALIYPWQKLLSIGTDFTFAWGNGLHFLAEHMYASASAKLTGYDQTINTSAVSLSYPLGIFDSLQGIVYYSWKTEKLFQYYRWQRTFDEFILNLSLFNYPTIQGLTSTLPLSGYGVQLMFIYNY